MNKENSSYLTNFFNSRACDKRPGMVDSDSQSGLNSEWTKVLARPLFFYFYATQVKTNLGRREEMQDFSDLAETW